MTQLYNLQIECQNINLKDWEKIQNYLTPISKPIKGDKGAEFGPFILVIDPKPEINIDCGTGKINIEKIDATFRFDSGSYNQGEMDNSEYCKIRGQKIKEQRAGLLEILDEC